MSDGYIIQDEVAAFVGAEDLTTADPQLEADYARLTLIRTALQQGATWQRIGRTLGMGPQEAKRHHKHLTATTRRAWYLHHNQEDRQPPA